MKKSRNPPERSWNLYLCPTNSNSRLGITLPGHGKGGIEDDIRNPDGRGRHSETLTKEEKNIEESERPKYGGHKKRGRYSSEKQRSEKFDTVSSQLGGRNMEATRKDWRGRNTEATKEDQRGHEMIDIMTDLSH